MKYVTSLYAHIILPGPTKLLLFDQLFVWLGVRTYRCAHTTSTTLRCGPLGPLGLPSLKRATGSLPRPLGVSHLKDHTNRSVTRASFALAPNGDEQANHPQTSRLRPAGSHTNVAHITPDRNAPRALITATPTLPIRPVTMKPLISRHTSRSRPSYLSYYSVNYSSHRSRAGFNCPNEKTSLGCMQPLPTACINRMYGPRESLAC